MEKHIFGKVRHNKVCRVPKDTYFDYRILQKLDLKNKPNYITCDLTLGFPIQSFFPQNRIIHETGWNRRHAPTTAVVGYTSHSRVSPTPMLNSWNILYVVRAVVYTDKIDGTDYITVPMFIFQGSDMYIDFNTPSKRSHISCILRKYAHLIHPKVILHHPIAKDKYMPCLDFDIGHSQQGFRKIISALVNRVFQSCQKVCVEKLKLDLSTYEQELCDYDIEVVKFDMSTGQEVCMKSCNFDEETD